MKNVFVLLLKRMRIEKNDKDEDWRGENAKKYIWVKQNNTK